MNTPPHDYRPSIRSRTTGGLLELKVRKDHRQASLSLNGVLPEVGTPVRIEQRYRTLVQTKV